VRRYRARISAPLLDRIDLQIEVPRVPLAELDATASGGESTADVRRRVVAARDRQQARAGKPNVALDNREVQRDCTLAGRDRDLLVRSLDRLGLSARAYHRILRVARTIADLAGEESIRTPHLTEAIQYRRALLPAR
jgi:magnesium chelatase family protein